MTLPAVSWAIDGIPTPLAGWSSTTTAFGGFGQMRGTIKESDARRIPSSVVQGSLVKGFTDSGTVVFEGRLSAPPAIRGGLASFAAQGESVRVAKQAIRLLYQTRDVRNFANANSSPHNYAGGINERDLSVEVRDGSILYRLILGALPVANDANAAVFWAPGGPQEGAAITRYGFDWISSGATIQLDIRGQTMIGPGGSGTVVGTHSLNATSGSIDQTINPGLQLDQLFLELRVISNITSNPVGVNWVVRNLRVNGISDDDTFLAHEVIRDVGGRVGYDTSKITSTGLNVLPLDWTSGSWAELLSYIATLADRYWRVVEDQGDGPVIEYDPWGTKEWTVYQNDGATVDLTPLELYNQVSVKYVDVGGAPRAVNVVADPDPLAASGITNVWEESLSDVQPNSDLATAAANTLLPRVSTLREQGRIDVVRAYDSTGRDAPYEIRAGDTVRIADRDMNTATTHRVFEVEYTPNGVALGIESGVSIASLLGRAGLVGARAPSTAQLPPLEPKVTEPSGIPSEEEQHRARFLPWPEPFKKPAWRKIRP